MPDIISNMIPPSEKHHRRSIRLRDFDYSRLGTYFITLCTWERECLFGMVWDGEMRLSGAREIVSETWLLLPGRFPGVVLDEMKVMPNHIHGLIHFTVGAIHELPLHELPPHKLPRDKPQSGMPQPETPLHLKRRRMLLPKVVGFFKMNAAKRINRMRHTPGCLVWQRNYYEHVVRNENALNAIRRYILFNPAMWPHDSENPNERHSLLDMPRNALVQCFGFTDKELDFIINYEINSRKGRDTGEKEK